jgi:hypothetical protein
MVLTPHSHCAKLGLDVFGWTSGAQGCHLVVVQVCDQSAAGIDLLRVLML